MFIVTVSVNICRWLCSSTNRNSVRCHVNSAPASVHSVKRSIEGRLRKCTQRHTISQCKAVKPNSGSGSAGPAAGQCWLSITLTKPETDRTKPYKYVVIGL